MALQDREESMDVPLEERGGRLRGALDLATGRYPGFVFGGRVRGLLPVFHFHDVSRETLEERLRHLAENGYRTVGSEALERYVRRGVDPGPGSVVLCFDDAYRSLRTAAAPLLRSYGFRAVAFAIPGRVPEGNGAAIPPGDETGNPFATWPELRALHEEGVVEVQSHTHSHSLVFTSHRIVDFVTPAYRERPLLSRPRAHEPGRSPGRLRFLEPEALGAPLHPARSRMSDGFRYLEDGALRHRLVEHVRSRGGPAFFQRPDWRSELLSLAGSAEGCFESAGAREEAIRQELGWSREVLEGALRCPVRHVCFPWGTAGALAVRGARETGYRTAFADRWLGRRAVRAGDDPFRLMRLPHRYIHALPGRGRRLVPFLEAR